MTATTNQHDSLPALLTIHDIAALLKVGRTTAYARTRDPEFPDPLAITGACYRWYAHEVLRYLESRRTEKKDFQPRLAADLGPLPVPRALPRARPVPRSRESTQAGPSGRSPSQE